MFKRIVFVVGILVLTAGAANAYTATKKGLGKRLMAVMTQVLDDICACETQECLVRRLGELREPRLAVAGRRYYLNASKVADDLMEWKASPDAATWDGYAFELFVDKEHPKFRKSWDSRFERCATVIGRR